jgi:hypothetical protein
MQNLGQTVGARFLDFSAFQLFLIAAKGSFWQNLGYLSTFGLSALFSYFLGFLGSYELVQVKKVSCRVTDALRLILLSLQLPYSLHTPSLTVSTTDEPTMYVVFYLPELFCVA